MNRVWQLPPTKSKKADHNWIHPKSKYHAYTNKHNKSMCEKHDRSDDFFETGLAEKAIIESPHIACAVCFELASGHYCHECKNSLYFYKLRAVEETEVTAIDDEFLERGEITRPINIITHTYCSKCNGLVAEPMERE